MGITLFNPFASASALTASWGLAAAQTSIPPTISDPIVTDCYPPGCIDIMNGWLHPRELKIIREFAGPSSFFGLFSEPAEENSVEYLRFRNNDPKDKFLYLAVPEFPCPRSIPLPEMDPIFKVSEFDPILKLLSIREIRRKFDVKYKIVRSLDEICKEVTEASRIGKIRNILIDAQGNCDLINLGDGVHDFLNYTRPISVYLDCFKDIDPSGKITLLISDAGNTRECHNRTTIAQRIANAAKRIVIAPIGRFNPTDLKIPNMDDFEIFHSDQRTLRSFKSIYQAVRNGQSIFQIFYDSLLDRRNLFKAFYPIFEDCVNVFWDKVNAREQAAIETIRQERVKNTTLTQPTELHDLQDVLGFCRDDPRQKFLYLSAEHDYNGALNPKWQHEILYSIFKSYDLKFKVVKSYDELCEEVKQASKMEELINIVINGHGNSNGIQLGNDNTCNSFLHTCHGHLSKCFNGLNPSAKITLIGCKTSFPRNADPNDVFAKDIAKASKRTVVAPNELIYANLVKLVSIVPFNISHPSEKDPKENVFKTFNP